MITAEEDRRERHVAWCILIGVPASLIFLSLFSFMGVMPGIEAGHPAIYLEATCFAWAIVSTVLPILRLLRILSVPPIFLIVVYGDIYFYVLSLNVGLYLNVSWWGDMGHVISSMVVTMIVFISMCAIQSRSPSHVTLGTNGGVAMMTFMIALSFGGVWEMIEGFADFAGGQSYMVYGANDTMGDLTADLLGAAAFSTVAYWYLGRHTAAEISSGLRIGRKAFEVSEGQ